MANFFKEELANRLNVLCENYSFTTAWCVWDIEHDNYEMRNGNLLVPASSIRKVFIMMAALSAVNAGLITLETKLQLNHKQVEETESIGCLQFLKPGFYLTFQDLVTLMIIAGDNVATSIVVEKISMEYINNYCHSLGFVNTVHRAAIPIPGIPYDYPINKMNTTTAFEVAKLLKMILDGTRDLKIAAQLKCTVDLCNLALKILGWQQGFSEFPILLPEEASIAHKHGWGVRNCGDAGIFYKNGKPKFIMTVLTDNIFKIEKNGLSGHVDAVILIAKLAKMVWDELS
jgi:beta-lactamase class A